MTGAENLLRTAIANGLEICFMNPGTSEMHFVAALDRVPAMRGVLCLFEGVCSGAADGYARMKGKAAATLLHLGPGLGNGLANFHNARKARSPVVSIVGEHSTKHLRFDAPLSTDIVAFARTVSSDVRVVRSPEEMGQALAETIVAAHRPPGNVAMLIVAADFSWQTAGEPGRTLKRPLRQSPCHQDVQTAARILLSEEKAGLLLNGSAVMGRGLEAAGRLAAATGTRVFVDRTAARLESGKGRFHPQRIAYFPESAEAMLAGLQHLVLVEAKTPIAFFGYPGRRSELLAEDTRVHVLAAPEQDGAAALEALVNECRAGRAVPPAEPVFGAVLPRGSGSLTLDAVGRTINALLPEGAIVSDETVSSGGALWPWLVSAALHDHLPVTGGAIGQGLPVAIGAALACPGRKTVALEGDGSAMYTPQALWTAAREQLDVVAVILANRRYRILEVEMRRMGIPEVGQAASNLIDIGRPELDWKKLAEGMGVPATRAITADEFSRQFEAAMRTTGPHLIEAVVSDSNDS